MWPTIHILYLYFDTTVVYHEIKHHVPHNFAQLPYIFVLLEACPRVCVCVCVCVCVRARACLSLYFLSASQFEKNYGTAS